MNSKKSFDDRSQTPISISIQNRHTGLQPPQDLPYPLEGDSILNWNDTKKIYRLINSPDFIIKYGNVRFMEPCSIYIGIGTNKGYVVVFNYHQELEYVLEPQQAVDEHDHYLKDMSVTSMVFSADLLFVAAGYINGVINIWELKKTKNAGDGDTDPNVSQISDFQVLPYHTIHPITLEDRFNKNKEGHLNVMINCVKFCHNNEQLISSDVSGLIFYHHGIKRLLTRVFITQKLLGKNDSNATPKDSNSLFTIEVLSFGNLPQITDQLCVVAIITASTLNVISILSLNNPSNLLIKSHFKVHKPKSLSPSVSLPCLDWFPCVSVDGRLANSRLAYSWNNSITILELANDTLPPNLVDLINDLKDKDKNIPVLPVSKTCRHYLPEGNTIISLKWVSNSILHAFTESQIFMFHYTSKKKLQILTQEKIDFNLKALPLKFNKNLLSTSYDNCIKLIRNRILILRNEEGHHDKVQITIGKSINWADKLIELLTKSRYQDALTLVNFFYNSGNNQLMLYSLPDNDTLRKQLVYPYLIKILKESIPKLDFTKFDITQIFQINFTDNMAADSDEILEALYEHVDSKMFFDTIEEFLLSNYITRLPPLVLRELVRHYASIGRGDILTEILCTIDITTLDIDLAISTCNQYELTDCLIFIWNYLLNDYQTPFIESLEKVKADLSDKKNINIFHYLSYILTGRQYPIDKYIDFEKEYEAKIQILQVLFTQENIVDSIFPNLTVLLKYSSFDMLSTLNEFFEDSMLNDDEVQSEKNINRQYIIEALLDIYGSNEFSNIDKCHLSIFIGRNYPKYSQFIRLSDSILNQILDNLLNFSQESIKSDCELAVQSLLSVFEPFDEGKLIEKLNHAKFYNVLINIYKVNGKYDKYLKLYLQLNKQHDQFVLVLQECLNNSRYGLNRVNLINLIKENFVKFISIDLNAFIGEINKFDKPLHKEILKHEDPELQYNYLSQLFGAREYMNSELLMKYIELSCKNGKNVFKEVREYYKFIEPEQLGELEMVLKEYHQISSLTIHLNAQGKYQQSLDELLADFGRVVDEKTVLDQEIEVYIRILESKEFYQLPQGPQNPQDPESEDLNLNEHYWLQLINKLIEHSSKTNHINDYIYLSFKKISDIKLNPQDKNESSFLKIFNKFLVTNNATLLLNIKNILIDILISYSYESEILRLGSKSLNDLIYDKLKVIRYENIKGWNISCKYCTNCNKKMFGSDIDPRNYLAWETKQMNKLMVFKGRDHVSSDFSGTLIFFKCSHGYHDQCLKNLNSNQCVICCQ